MKVCLRHCWQRWSWLFTGLLHCFILLITSIAIGVGFIHISGLPFRIGADEVALRNYLAVLGYLSPFSYFPFDLPDLPYSSEGAQHFYECKIIFRNLYAFAVFIGLPFCIFIQSNRKRCTATFWLVSAVSSLFLIVAVLISFLFGFAEAFRVMHEILFDNEFWLFDGYTDPIIYYLPHSFFIQCGFILLGFAVASIILSFWNFYCLKNQALPKNR